MKPIDRNSIDQDIDDLGRSEGWPLQLVVFGDFQPQDDSGQSTTIESRTFDVDKDSFDEVLSSLAGELVLRIPDSDASVSGKEWVHLPLMGIRSFRPEAVVEAVPELRELLDTRKLASQLAESKLSLKEFQSQVSRFREGERILERLQAAEPVPVQKPKGGQTVLEGPDPRKRVAATQADDLVDSILGIVDLPGAGQSKPAVSSAIAEVESLISEIRETETPCVKVNPGVILEIISELDERLGAGLEPILHHSEFRRLEALWRGLKFLVDRTDFREPIRVEIRCNPKEDLLESLALFGDDVESRGGLESDTVILAVYEFDPSSRDMEILRRLSEMAEALQVPVISSVGLNFFGFKSAAEIERLSHLGAIFDQRDYAKWRSLREVESSRWLTLIFNRFLLRYPYDPEQIRVRTFEYREGLATSSGAAHLWANPLWGLASLLTIRFAATGNCLEFTGWQSGLIEDLPIREVRLRSGEAVQNPLELMISDDQLADLTRAGIVTLVSKLNTDSAALLSAPTVHLPERYGDEEETRQARLRAILPYQFFVSRMAVCAQQITGAISPGLPPDTVSALVKKVLVEFVPGKRNAEAVEVEVVDSKRLPDSYDVALTLRPERAGWNLPPVRLQLRVSK